MDEKFKQFIKELLDFTILHKDGTENQYVSNQDALAAYYIITHMVIKTEGDILLFLTANNLLNVYVKEEHAIKAFDYYFKHSIAILLYYAKINDFKHFKIDYIDSELFNNNLIMFSLYDLQFSYHGMPIFIKSRIPLKYKDNFLFSGIKHKSCVNDLFHLVIKNKQFFSNLTYRKEPLLEMAYQYADTCDLNSISKRKFKDMLPGYCFNNSGQQTFNTEALDKHGLEKHVGRRYIVSAILKNKVESFDKVIEYLRNNEGILVNLPSTADYLLVRDIQDLGNELRKLNGRFNAKVLILHLDNLKVEQIDDTVFLSMRDKAIHQTQNTPNPNKRLQRMWGEFYRANAERASLEENKSKLVTISSTLKQNEKDLTLVIELIKAKGLIPCDKIGMSSYIYVKDEEDLKRLSSTFKHPYQGQFIKLK